MNTPVTQFREWRQIDANPDRRVTVSPHGELQVGKRTWGAGKANREANFQAIGSFRNALKATGDEHSHRYRGLTDLATSHLAELEDAKEDIDQRDSRPRQPASTRQAQDLTTHDVKSVTLKHSVIKRAINNACRKSREDGGSGAFNFAKFRAWAETNRPDLEDQFSQAPNNQAPDHVLEAAIAELGLALEEAIIEYLESAELDTSRADQLLAGGNNLSDPKTLPFDQLLHQRQEVSAMLEELGKLNEDDPQRQRYEDRLQELRQKYDHEEQRRDLAIGLRRFLGEKHRFKRLDSIDLKKNFEEAKKYAELLQSDERFADLATEHDNKLGKILGGYQRETTRRNMAVGYGKVFDFLNRPPPIAQNPAIEDEKSKLVGAGPPPIAKTPSIDDPWDSDEEDDDDLGFQPSPEPINIDSELDDDGYKRDL